MTDFYLYIPLFHPMSFPTLHHFSSLSNTCLLVLSSHSWPWRYTAGTSGRHTLRCVQAFRALCFRCQSRCYRRCSGWNLRILSRFCWCRIGIGGSSPATGTTGIPGGHHWAKTHWRLSLSVLQSDLAATPCCSTPLYIGWTGQRWNYPHLLHLGYYQLELFAVHFPRSPYWTGENPWWVKFQAGPRIVGVWRASLVPVEIEMHKVELWLPLPSSTFPFLTFFFSLLLWLVKSLMPTEARLRLIYQTQKCGRCIQSCLLHNVYLFTSDQIVLKRT